MILLDTSVWVDHFRFGLSHVHSLLEIGEVLCHPWIVGELACGHIRNRAEIISRLKRLPTAPSLSPEELFSFIEAWKLQGRGIGWVDVHLLASARLHGIQLWTMDKNLKKAAYELEVEYVSR